MEKKVREVVVLRAADQILSAESRNFSLLADPGAHRYVTPLTHTITPSHSKLDQMFMFCKLQQGQYIAVCYNYERSNPASN